jgi:hypothetical protein
VFRYSWWILTATQEVEIAESLGLLNGAAAFWVANPPKMAVEKKLPKITET